jgi:glycosyltransferase involved in cell wall biosynthesis
MKILHLTEHFFPEYSGSATRLYGLLSRLPYEVYLITSDRTIRGEIIPKKEEKLDNIAINRIPLVPSNLVYRTPPLRYAHALWREPGIIAKHALKMQIDILHAHNSLIFGEAAQELSKQSNIPFVVEVHVLSKDYSAGFLAGIKASYNDWVDRKVLSRCDHIVTLTQSLKECLIDSYKLPETKITVVPNGANIELFSPKSENNIKAEELKHTLGINDKVVMYAGVMDWMNGIRELAKVIPQIVRELRSVCFVFIGRGPEEGNLVKLSKEYPDNVKLVPMVPHSSMPAYYQMCDVFVIPRPSYISTETLIPLKLLEVMAMEKAVLGSNVGGITEVIEHGNNGYLFEKENINSFGKVLLEVLGSDNTRIGVNARKTIVTQYTWDKSVRTLQRIYEAMT